MLDANLINDLLPQTQCTRCGYPDCAGYAEAIARGEAGINQCPPGGDEGVRRLAQATGLAYAPLDPYYGEEAPLTVAVIDVPLAMPAQSMFTFGAMAVAVCPLVVSTSGVAPDSTELMLPPLCE